MSQAEYQTTRLSNGVTIATASMPWMESVALGIWAGIGARHEPAALHGIAHFTEHLLFKGTEQRTARQIVGDIESMGASSNAFTAQDHTCYYAKGPAERFARVSEILVDMFRHSTFPEDEVAREREIIEEEIVMYREQPAQHVEDLLGATVWSGHPLGRSITGSNESLRKIGRDDFFQFTRDYYAGRGTVIAVAGRINHGEALDQLGPLVEDMTGGKRPRLRRFQPGAEASGNGAPRICVENRDIEQAHLSLGFHACSREHPDRYALKLLSVLLGENMSSRLFQLLREQHGFCYQVQSDTHTLEDTGLWQLYLALDPSNLFEALRLICRELAKAARRPPSADELRQACDYTVAQSRISLESTTQQMMWTGESIAGYGEIIHPEDSRKRFFEVAPEDIHRVAGSVFRAANLGIALVGPKCDPREIVKRVILPA